MSAPTRSGVRVAGDQKVTFVELFFDLVFVFAITQVTKIVVSDLTWAGGAESLLVFWMIWWAWTQFTWSLNPADTTHGVVRAVTLIATAVAFLMAIAVPNAFGDGGLWFALAYVAVRLLGLGIQIITTAGSDEQRGAVRVFALGSGPSLLLALVGGLVDTPWRAWAWLGVVLLDLVAVAFAGRSEEWDVRPGHFAERHGLIIIIALGESLIVAGQSVLDAETSALLISVALGAVVITCVLWWLYFGWWQEAMEERLAALSGSAQARFARDAYSLLHFLIMAGIIAMAAGIEEMVLHPDETLPSGVKVALAIGMLSYLGGTAAGWWRGTGQVLLPRVVIALAAAGAILLVDTAALGEISLLAAALALVGLLEHRSRRGAEASAR